VKAYDASPTLDNAINVGASMRDRYLGKVEEYAMAERGVGLGLIGSTAVAADLAIRSISSTSVLALGLVSAAGYTANNWLVSKPQQKVYAAGANAVQCALDAMQPMIKPYRDRDTLENELNAMNSLADELRLMKPNGTSLNEAKGRLLLERATTLDAAGKDALALIDTAPGTLRASLALIQTQVANAYIDNSPQLQALLDSLGKALPSTGGKIIGVTLSGVPAPATSRAAETSSPDMDKKVDDLEQKIQHVSRMIDAVNAKPSEDRLKLCQVDVKQAGLLMRFFPSSELTVKAGGASSTSVTGGVLPYRIEWVGARPPTDQVDKTIESGQGVITVHAKAGAKPDNYRLLVLDSGQGRELLNVFVVTADATMSAAKMTAKLAGTQAAVPDPLVKKVQGKLIEQGIKTVKVGDKDRLLIADGVHGKVTEAALVQFYQSQAKDVPVEQIPHGEKLLKDVAGILGIKTP
jgi:hypothetical protein